MATRATLPVLLLVGTCQQCTAQPISRLSASALEQLRPRGTERPPCAGSSNLPLATEIAQTLGFPLMAATVERFNDGEINIQLGESVRNVHVYVVQSTCMPVNDNLFELFLLIRCLRRASAKSITAVMPYYGYARQDRKMTARVPISASDVAIMLESAGVDRVLAVRPHLSRALLEISLFESAILWRFQKCRSMRRARRRRCCGGRVGHARAKRRD
jgi:hypothetical protein